LLIGIEIDGDPIEGNDAFWEIQRDGQHVGHVTRCVYSPRLKKNIGWANVLAAQSEIGTELTLVTPQGTKGATICETPWVKSFTGIPEEIKEQARKG
jgi:aminomethyltransferase